MDKLIAVEEMEFDSPVAISAKGKPNLEVDPEKYRNYLSVNPIWDFLSLSKDDYFKLSTEDRKSHIENYYKYMLNGKRRYCFRFFFFILILDWVRFLVIF